MSRAISRKAVTLMPTVCADQLSGSTGGLMVELFTKGPTAPVCSTQMAM